MGKACTKCTEWKDGREFQRDRRARDGLQSWCRECMSRYSASEPAKAGNRRATKRYRASAGGRASRHRYHRSNAGKASSRRYRISNAAKRRCQSALYYAIGCGTIIRPMLCSACGKAKGVIRGHHADYSKPFEVEWLCRDCHRRLHAVLAQRIKEIALA